MIALSEISALDGFCDEQDEDEDEQDEDEDEQDEEEEDCHIMRTMMTWQKCTYLTPCI